MKSPNQNYKNVGIKPTLPITRLKEEAIVKGTCFRHPSDASDNSFTSIPLLSFPDSPEDLNIETNIKSKTCLDGLCIVQ